ncbi:MAG: o-succinylbenzoate synthase, partial [Propionibacteriaceae bacterium]|nr:o-succinylbenzoate synthase [Propionibacteriaceae bacterium]
MRITQAELLTLRMPLKAPFVTSFGREDERFPLLVRVFAEEDGRQASGWGECVAMREPMYSPEYLDSAREVVARFLLPLLAAAQRESGGVEPEQVRGLFPHVVGHQMAKAAVEMAVLDARLRLDGRSFAQYLGAARDTVPSGVSVGIQPSIGQLVEVVGRYLEQGYARVKIKIAPGWVVEPVAAIREEFGDIPLQVDANSAFTLDDAPLLAPLDDFGLLLIEQPLGE